LGNGFLARLIFTKIQSLTGSRNIQRLPNCPNPRVRHRGTGRGRSGSRFGYAAPSGGDAFVQVDLHFDLKFVSEEPRDMPAQPLAIHAGIGELDLDRGTRVFGLPGGEMFVQLVDLHPADGLLNLPANASMSPSLLSSFLEYNPPDLHRRIAADRHKKLR
jgi:hypothetical protein